MGQARVVAGQGWRGSRRGGLAAFLQRLPERLTFQLGRLFVNQQTRTPGVGGGDAVPDRAREQRGYSTKGISDLRGDLPLHPGGRAGNTEEDHSEQLKCRVVLASLHEALHDPHHALKA